MIWLTIIGAGAAFLGLIWATQRQLIYFPDTAAPRLDAAGWHEVGYDTEDGLTLIAWYRPPEDDQPVIVVFNGNAGNRAGRLGLGEALAGHGAGVLLTDYRGYGGNPGSPSEAGLRRDADAAAAFVERTAPEAPTVYFGESLGSAVAVDLAGARPPAALVLRSPFTSMVELGRHHYPVLPVSALLRDRFAPIDVIARLQVPTLVIAGDADSIVPLQQSKAIYTASPGPKELLIIEGGDHNDWELVSGPAVVEAVHRFVDQWASG